MKYCLRARGGTEASIQRVIGFLYMTDALGLERSLADSFMGFIVSLFDKSKRLSYESSRVLRFKNAIFYRMTEL